MSYKPEKSMDQVEQELQYAVRQRIDQLLGTIEGIGTMYVEPGDVVLVTLKDDMEQHELTALKKMLSSVFSSNTGLFTSDNIEFKILKKVENNEKENNEKEDNEKERGGAQDKVQDLTSRIEKLERKIEELVFSSKD
jgi:hypothetical protein